jgi:hypothetical protein
MNPDPIDNPSSPSPHDPSGGLTKRQRAFAEVIGHALAEAWRRKGPLGSDRPPASSPKAARGRTWTD